MERWGRTIGNARFTNRGKEKYKDEDDKKDRKSKD